MIVSTPWGISKTIEILPDKMMYVETMVHGGIAVPVELAKDFPAAFKVLLTSNWALQDTKYFWFERDQDFSIPVVSFPNIAKSREHLIYAIHTLRDWHPELYEAHYKVRLTPQNSYLLHIEKEGLL